MWDHRVMAQMVLNLGSSDVGGDAISEDPQTEIPVMSLYAVLGRLVDMPQEVVCSFSYAEVGQSTGAALARAMAVGLTCVCVCT
jgi:hypothetical protein